MVTKPVPTLDGNRRILEKFFPDRLQATALAEFVRDTIGTALRASGTATVTVNDDGDTITIGATGSTGGTGVTDPEVVRDTMAAALVAGSNVTITVNDPGDTITIGATSVTDPEVVRDTIGATLVAGTGMQVVVNDSANTITLNCTVTGGSGGGISQADVGAYWTVRKRPVEISGLVAGQDNTSVLNQAIANATAHDTLVVPRGAWTHSGTIQHAKADVTVQGPATLVGTVPRYGGYHITGNRATVRNLIHRVDGATGRGAGENFDDCPWSIDGAVGVTLEDVESAGSRDAQFFISGAVSAQLRNLIGRDSWADGLHISGGSQDILVDGVTITDARDDGIAVVSYTNDAAPVRGVRVSRGRVVNSDARGATIAGGEDITFTDIDVTRSRAAAYYIAHEQGQFNTRPVTRARILGGTAADANWDSSLDHGAIAIFNLVAGTAMTDVLIAGIIATDMRKNTPGGPCYAKVGNSAGNGGTWSNVQLRDITLQGGTTSSGLFVDRANTTYKTVGAFSYVTATAGNGFAPTDEGFTGNGFTATRVRSGGRWASIGA